MPHVELPQAEFKVVMLGDTNAGKTSLVLRFAEGHYREAAREPTVGAFFITKRIQTSNGITCKIQIWDTAGQAKFRSMAPMYYRNAAAAIVCYDVTSAQSYRVMKDWLTELHNNVPAGSIVIAIAATKCDILSRQRCGESFEAESYANELGAIFVNTSSKENIGVIDLYQRVGERVLKFRDGTSAGIPVTPGKTALHTSALSNGDSHLIHADKNLHLGSAGGLNDSGENNLIESSPHEETWSEGANEISNSHDNSRPGFTENKEGGTSSNLTGRGKGVLSSNRQPPPIRTGNNELGSSAGETISGIICAESPMGCGMFTSSSNADDSLVDENEVLRESNLERNIPSCCIS